MKLEEIPVDHKKEWLKLLQQAASLGITNDQIKMILLSKKSSIKKEEASD